MVLTIPPVEAALRDETIGARYVETVLEYSAPAYFKGLADLVLPLPADDDFNQVMTQSVYSRFLRQEAPGSAYWVSDFISDFTAMELITPLEGTYCAPVICRFLQANERFACVSIAFLKTDKTKDLLVRPGDKAWNLAKAYALQGAAYHALFVVHPTLHFPMDSVNAITKSAVPMIHPIFQALLPHTAYTLTLDNAVLEGAWTVVNDKVHETWFDPLTATGYNVKQLFGVGYSGYKGLAAYPAFDYMAPWMDAEQLLSATSEELYRPHRREIVVLFLDLRGYTAFTQKHGADEVMRILGEFHAAMGEIIATYEATLERFAGDGMMIFLNDPVEIPDPAVKAGKMALDMQARFHELNKIWQQRNYSLSMGIGIAQGMATIGAIGFEGRRDYAAIGAVTNLAARLCSEADAGQILISSVVADNIEKTLRVPSIGELVLKGFSEPVQCYEIAQQLRPDAVEQVERVGLAAPVGV